MNDAGMNRMALLYMRDLQSVPQTVAEIASYCQSRLRRPCDDRTRRAVETLETLGYLARCEATAADEPLYKITASGLRQALRIVKPDELDPMIWG